MPYSIVLLSASVDRRYNGSKSEAEASHPVGYAADAKTTNETTLPSLIVPQPEHAKQSEVILEIGLLLPACMPVLPNPLIGSRDYSGLEVRE